MRNRRSLRYHGLNRPKLRQSWNKYNLWNLKSFRLPTLLRRTFFQQKWTAKAMMRAYHGEHVKERQWERMFSRRLNSVVNMEPRYMAEHDGSEQAAGRGSGREPAPLHPGQRTSWEEIYARSPSNRTVLGDTPTPHMQMAFAPLERRLDTAVFRAMFASSARQARQFVVHGGVTVNGQKVNHPGYLLNPGDMFQVEVDRVLTATGRLKEPRLIASVKRKRAANKARREADFKKRALSTWETWKKSPRGVAESSAVPEGDAAAAKYALAMSHSSVEQLREKILLILSGPETVNKSTKDLLLRMASSTAADGSPQATELLTPLGRHVHNFLNPPAAAGGNSPDAALAELYRLPEGQLEQLQARLQEARAELDALPPAEQWQYRPSQTREVYKALREVRKAAREEYLATVPESRQQADEAARKERLEARIQHRQLFPVDESKPYLTPWRPRPFIGAFAFIPRYLEVNQNICAAVYLRHPVARPGMGEVPTPFPPSIGQLAYNWYLRRG